MQEALNKLTTVVITVAVVSLFIYGPGRTLIWPWFLWQLIYGG